MTEGQKRPCPCCGAPMEADAVPREELASLIEKNSPVLHAIVRRLARRPGRMISVEELADYVWKDDSDGGPLEAVTAIHNAFYKGREAVQALGWDIECHYGRYRLVTLESAVHRARQQLAL